MVYKELRAILNLLNDIRDHVDRKDFNKGIKELEQVKDYEQILDEWKHFPKRGKSK